MARIYLQVRRILTKTYVQVFIFVGLFLLIAWVGNTYLQPKDTSDISGWLQTALAFLAVPLIIVQLREISQSLSRKPEISIGMVNTRELNLPNLRQLHMLPTTITLDKSLDFSLVIKNSGNLSTRNVKITLAYTCYVGSISNDRVPRISVPSYKSVKNEFINHSGDEFIFRPSGDWMINPHDIEFFHFGIYVTSPDDLKHAHVQIIEDQNATTSLQLECNFWADGLSEPITQTLLVKLRSFK